MSATPVTHLCCLIDISSTRTATRHRSITRRVGVDTVATLRAPIPREKLRGLSRLNTCRSRRPGHRNRTNHRSEVQSASTEVHGEGRKPENPASQSDKKCGFTSGADTASREGG